MGQSIGIDVGGTFTDLVSVSPEGHANTAKVLSTPHDQSEGVERALRVFGASPGSVDRIVHGTTVVTNMLLERRGARVVLCATAGATDLLELRRQERAALYDLSVQHPAPLVPRDHVVSVDERLTTEGVLIPLTREAAARAADGVAALDPEIIAIALLHAYRDASHERCLAEAIAARLPAIEVVCSADVLPEIREYERTATTCCEAYARPGVGRYLRRLADRLGALGLPAPGVVTSSGGMSEARDAAHAAASLALSGPAGGVAGAALVARLAGFDRALSIDIGGTSADVGLILDGEPLVEAGGAVAGVPIALPRVLVETVSAGGGSIGWIDAGGALRAGPRSAGAVPGPVAYGRGGAEPTVTDAHVALGSIRAEHISDDVRLDARAAIAAVAGLGERLGATVERTAAAMIAAADAAMARALRRVSVERGIDPRTCVLVAFGGGGPLHACGLAERLGIRRVLVPPHAGVLSALGLAIAPERRVAMTSVMRLVAELEPGTLVRLARSMAERAGTAARTTWIARLRYRGQGHELEVSFEPDLEPAALGERFAAAHHARYGFTLGAPVEMVSARCVRSGPTVPVSLGRAPRTAWNDDAGIDDGGAFDAVLTGPRVIALPDATLLVAPGWTARTLPIGGWMMELE
ncbi:MAG TPA: hydantoinase/oxoprolinase family protein [Gemmatimonadaceae bacterium]|nr:hydantoinase/oxoprolinase family protein [Gemmatimonadaceae bacterium]